MANPPLPLPSSAPGGAFPWQSPSPAPTQNRPYGWLPAQTTQPATPVTGSSYGVANSQLANTLATSGVTPYTGNPTGTTAMSMPVITGFTPRTKMVGGDRTPIPGTPLPQTDSIQNVLANFWAMSTDQMFQLGAKLVAAGQLPQSNANDPASIAQAYQNVLTTAAQMYQAGQQVSVNDLLATMTKQQGAAANRPASYTYSSTETNLTDPNTAKGLIQQTLASKLGRDPTAAEYSAFYAALTTAERNNPTVHKVTETYNKATNSYDQTAVSHSGGVDASSFAQQYGGTHNQVEAGAYQAATTYMNALMQAVGAPV